MENNDYLADHLEMKVKPESLEIHPTLACNLKCVYCSHRVMESYETIGDVATELGIPMKRICFQPHASGLKVEDFMAEEHVPLERQIKVIGEAFEMGIQRFKISGGGEPLCRPDLTCALIERIREGGGSIELITNGTLLEPYIDYLLKKGLTTLSISLDAASPEITDRRRGKKGTFSKIKRAIVKINSLKEKLNLRAPRLQIYAVLDRETVECISDLFIFSQENKVEKINFIPLKGKHKPYINKIGRFSSLEDNLSVKTNINDLFAMDNTDDTSSLLACSRPFNNIVIHGNGLVSPCCSMAWGVGAFVQEKSLEQIWKGRVFNEVRELMLIGKISKYCNACKELRVA